MENVLWDLSDEELRDKVARLEEMIAEYETNLEEGWTVNQKDRAKYKSNQRQLKALAQEIEYRKKIVPAKPQDE